MQKILTSFIDDLDGTEAEGTVRFGLDGVEYEIDLNAQNSETLRTALAPFVDAARIAKKTASAQRERVGSRASGRDDNKAVRTWLRWQGHEVKDRGRIPPTLLAIVPPNVAAIVAAGQNGTGDIVPEKSPATATDGEISVKLVEGGEPYSPAGDDEPRGESPTDDERAQLKAHTTALFGSPATDDEPSAEGLDATGETQADDDTKSAGDSPKSPAKSSARSSRAKATSTTKPATTSTSARRTTKATAASTKA